MEFFNIIVTLIAIVRSGYDICRKIFCSSNKQVPKVAPPSPDSSAESSETSFKEEIDMSGCEDILFQMPESIRPKKPRRIIDECPRQYPNKWIVDVSWETCNPTSAAVYNAVKEKAGYYAGINQYVIVGPYISGSAKQIIEQDLPSNNPLAITLAIMRQAGLRVTVGRWLVPGNPLTILLDITSGQQYLSQCRDMLEKRYSIKISANDNLVSGAIIFGHMVEAFLSILNLVLQKQAAAQDTVSQPIIAHFHEWTSAIGIMFMRMTNLAKGVAIGYTEYESPSMSYTRTGCNPDWKTHRDLFSNFAKYSADKHIKWADQLILVYDEAITKCQNEQVTLYFDMTWNFDYETHKIVEDCASRYNNTDRYVVLAPCFDETNVRDVVDEIVLPDGSPLAVAVQAIRRDGYKVTVGRLQIAGQPLIILFHILHARNNIHTRSNWNDPPLGVDNDESVYHHLASLFFSNLNNEMFRQEIRTGKRVPKSVRIYK